MTISADSLKLYLSVNVADDLTNGGAMSTNVLDTVNTSNNYFSDVLKEESVSGSITYRKLFCKQESDNNQALINAFAWIDTPTLSNDYFVIFPGTGTDTQAEINPTRVYGVSVLSENAPSGSNTFLVNVENPSLLYNAQWPIIKTGDIIRISDKEFPDSLTGNEEYLEVTSVLNTNDLGMQITTKTNSANAYTEVVTRISSVIKLGTIQANVSNITTASTNGTYTKSEILVDNLSTIDDIITLTINSDNTSYTVNSAKLGALSNGSILLDYSIENSNFSGHNYFEIKSSGWSGSWIQGDTIIITLQQSAKSIWQKRVIIPSTIAQSNNYTTIAFNGLTFT